MNYIYLVILLSAIIALLSVKSATKGIIALAMVIVTSVFSSIIAIPALVGHGTQILLDGTIPFGTVSIKIDALSAWFILVINFTMITGAIYGLNYMKAYAAQRSNLAMHWLSYILLHISLISICSVQNAMAFLLCWELMAVSAFILVIFENYKTDTLKAGINYLIQSHVSILFLMLGFIYVAVKTNSYDFNAIAEFSHQQSAIAGTVLFLSFFHWICHKSWVRAVSYMASTCTSCSPVPCIGGHVRSGDKDWHLWYSPDGFAHQCRLCHHWVYHFVYLPVFRSLRCCACHYSTQSEKITGLP